MSIYRPRTEINQITRGAWVQAPKVRGPFPRSFLRQHGSREKKSRPKRHSQQPAARQCGSVSAGCSEPCQVPPVSPPQSPHQPHEVRALLCPLHGQGQRIHVYGDRGPRKSGAGFPQPPNVPHGCIFSGLAPSEFNSILKSAVTQESLIQLSLLRKSKGADTKLSKPQGC